MRADQIKHRFLFVTSTTAAQDTLQMFSWRLLQEGHEIGVMGPSGINLPEEVPFFSRIPDAVEYSPEVVIPLDEPSIRAATNIFGKKPKFVNKDPLAYQIASTRSFGLSLMAKAGLQTVPYHTISNPNDMLRFRAKQAESEEPWEIFPDHPDFLHPSPDGSLGIQHVPGKMVRVGYLVSGKHLCKPSFVYTPLLGLLEKGGLRDFRGMVVCPVSGGILESVGTKIRHAISAMGAVGFVFADLIFQGDKPLVSRISLIPPKGFFAALLLSDLIQQSVGQALYSVAKGLSFNWRLKQDCMSWAHLITDCSTQDGLPDEPGFYQTSSVPGEYEVGFHVSTEPNVPDSLWAMRPTAEVKLRTNEIESQFVEELAGLGIRPYNGTNDQPPAPVDEVAVEEEEVEQYEYAEG